ncbi:PREDICTED: uncharacterized protein LOC109216840 isoform X5 [Nicotiana attenuata]|uniref:uncharacterized protein LOC109216840 isoform X5 n=1 Tax=Nicotiana attenuata TaxID=49451 RepID=UPI000904AF85|nr:PREDICTED: uncharacterized protein LOC109216840 isoform X5 [Nicotiana attenuata]
MLGQILVTKQTGAQGKVVSKGRTLGANIGGWEQNQWKTHLRERTRAKISSQRESKLNNCHLWLTVVPALPFSPYQQACSSNIVDRNMDNLERAWMYERLDGRGGTNSNFVTGVDSFLLFARSQRNHMSG